MEVVEEEEDDSEESKQPNPPKKRMRLMKKAPEMAKAKVSLFHLVQTKWRKLTKKFKKKQPTAEEKALAEQRAARAAAREARKTQPAASTSAPPASRARVAKPASQPEASSSKRKLDDHDAEQPKKKRKPRTVAVNPTGRRPMLPARDKHDPFHHQQILCQKCFKRGIQCKFEGSNRSCVECAYTKKGCLKLDPEDPCLLKDEAQLRVEELEKELAAVMARLTTLEETVRLSEAVIPNLEAALSIILAGGDTSEILRKLERDNHDYDKDDEDEDEEMEDPKGKGKGKAKAPAEKKGKGKGKGKEK